jgi:hypothetical protein
MEEWLIFFISVVLIYLLFLVYIGLSIYSQYSTMTEFSASIFIAIIFFVVMIFSIIAHIRSPQYRDATSFLIKNCFVVITGAIIIEIVNKLLSKISHHNEEKKYATVKPITDNTLNQFSHPTTLDPDNLIESAKEKLGFQISYNTICEKCKKHIEFSDYQKGYCHYCSYQLSPIRIRKAYIVTIPQEKDKVFDYSDLILFLKEKLHLEEQPQEVFDQQKDVPQINSNVIGKTCPYCQTPIKPGIPVVICPECKIPHHKECWEENVGCTTYGCKYTK